MINSSNVETAAVSMKILTADQIEEIKWTAYEVVSKTGLKVLHAGVRKTLKQAGAIVNGEIVKVP